MTAEHEDARVAMREAASFLEELIGLDLLPSSEDAPPDISSERAAELAKALRWTPAPSKLDDATVEIGCDLATYWTFGVTVPASEAVKPGFDPEAALEAAYGDGADWGDLNDHAFENVTVNGYPLKPEGDVRP